MDLQTIDQRLGLLEDIEAIKSLKAEYCFGVDDNDIDRVVALFLDDALWHAPGIGRYEGRDAIDKFFRTLPEMMRFWLHMVMNPQIHVEGDRARGRWYLIEPNTTHDGQAVWGAGRYEERYRRREGRWFFEEVELLPIFWTPYDEGWAKTRNLFDPDPPGPRNPAQARTAEK